MMHTYKHSRMVIDTASILSKLPRQTSLDAPSLQVLYPWLVILHCGDVITHVFMCVCMPTHASEQPQNLYILGFLQTSLIRATKMGDNTNDQHK